MYKHSADGGCSAAPAIIVTISDAPRTRTRVVGQRSSMFVVFPTDYKLCLNTFKLIFSWTEWRFQLRRNSLLTIHTGGTERTTDYMDRIST